MELAKMKWYKTTGGKIGIVIGSLAVLTGVTLLVRHFIKKGAEKKDDTKQIGDQTKTDTTTATTTQTTEPAKTETTPNEKPNPDLPNNGVGCGPVRTAFDRVFNYVKCAGVWYTISKDKIKISKWKSLADNKTATDLLNNKYPS